ncbi:MAG: hypothetical protein Q9223_007390, partial [Gallowayella weberi]
MTHLDLLSSKQAHALFDILTSHVTLTEIESLKHSKTIATFGPPLQPSSTDPASTPLLRILLQSFIDYLPGFKDVTSHFWTDSIYRLGTALDDANLSQSYDKGSVGIRRTLSTASASIIESVARGRLGGYPKRPLKEDSKYDRAIPDDVVKAWDDFLQRIIYGDLLDKMFVKASETDNLSDHEPVVLTAEVTELRKRAKQIEQSKDSPDKSQMDRLCKYVSEAAEEQQRIRNESESRSISIAAAITGQDKILPPLTESSHKLALDYVSIKLAIRDREKLIEVLCHHSPDLVTKSIRELVTVYDPIIRALHKAVDLSAGVTDLQNFIDDLINLSLIDKTKPAKLPTVQDFCRLLEKHQKSSHVFIHQALKNGKELSQWYHEYASHAIEQYKQMGDIDAAADGKTAAGDFTRCLNDLVSKLSEDQRQQVLKQLDQHATFLDSLAQQSKARMDKTVRASLEPKSSNNEVEGNPGMFLLKWQLFIDQTAITPGPTDNQPRSGKTDSVVDATAVDVDGEKSATTHQA